MAIVDIDLIPIGSGETPLPQGVLYDNGKGIKNWDNGIYVANATYTLGAKWIEEERALRCPTTESRKSYSIVTKESLNLSTYSKVYITYSWNGNIITNYLDVSSISSGYVVVALNRWDSTRNLNIYTTNVKANYESDYSKFKNLSTNENVDVEVKIMRVWLE